MDFYEVIKAAADNAHVGGALISLPPNRWDKVSINGHQTATVTAHGIGFKEGFAWTFFTFKDDTSGKVQTIWGKEDSHSHATISLADGEHDDQNLGTQEQNPRIVLQPIIMLFTVKVSVRFKFTDSSHAAQEYRFDGRSWP